MVTAGEDENEEEVKEMDELGLTNRLEPFSSTMKTIGNRISKPRDKQIGTYIGIASKAIPPT